MLDLIVVALVIVIIISDHRSRQKLNGATILLTLETHTTFLNGVCAFIGVPIGIYTLLTRGIFFYLVLGCACAVISFKDNRFKLTDRGLWHMSWFPREKVTKMILENGKLLITIGSRKKIKISVPEKDHETTRMAIAEYSGN